MYIRLLQMALKCADLGHLASPERVHRQWVHLLEEEMFRQGDLEKARGYVVSPLMDRDKGGITKSQPGVRLDFNSCVRTVHTLVPRVGLANAALVGGSTHCSTK